jgi:hypothetical protein
MSEGTPTALTRDGEIEGRDPVPDGPFTVTPVRVVHDPSPDDGTHLRRADDAQQEGAYDSKRAKRRVLDIIDQHPLP